MADANWQKMREIFDSALRRKPEERAEYLAEACGGDQTLLQEVESLFASLDSAESFLEKPAVEVVADAIEPDGKKLGQGETLGHYEIIKQIGEGGMGEVYLAEDKKLDRKVAVKLLNEKFSRDESNLQRFIREAKAASALNHPNILVIHEIGEENKAHYIVSEYIKGETLREIQRGKTLKLSEILDIAIQTANALVAAHEVRLIHRDIKPENIMIRPDCFVKVLDFGLAKLVEQKNSSLFGLEASTLQQSHTAEGIILGTISYMSPEQAKGERVDGRTDIFSLGVVLYEMLAGITPFAGETISETFANLINQEPLPLSRYTENVPAELQRIVSKTLRKDKDLRYQTMKGLLSDLRELRENLSLEEKLQRSGAPNNQETVLLQATTGDANLQTAQTQDKLRQRFTRRQIIFASVIIILLLAAVTVPFYLLKNKAAQTFDVGETTRLTSSGKVKAAVVSPDGKFIIYTQEENGERQSLWMQHVGSESSVQIAAPASINYYSLNISPDGNSLYYIDSNYSLYRMAILGGTPKKLLDGLLANYDSHIGFSPDGKQIAFVRGFEKEKTALFVANADGTKERLLAPFEQPIRLGAYSAWSPDGKVIACWFISEGLQNILAIQVADGTHAPILSKGWSNIVNLKWMPDSRSLLVVGNKPDGNLLLQIWQISYPHGKEHQIIGDTNNYKSINVTSDGGFLAVRKIEQVAHIWKMPSDDASRARQLTTGFEKVDGTLSLGWMPDGKIIYHTIASGKSAAWVMEADGSNPRQMGDEGRIISPDGHYLIAQRGKNGLWRIDFKDGGEKQLTKGVDVGATFSPDGKWIVYTGYGERVALLKVPIEGGEPTQILGEQAAFPAVSPDGKTIAFILRKARQPIKIALVSFSGGEIIKTFDAKPEIPEFFSRPNLQWTADGKGIYFIALNNGVSNIWMQPIDGKPPVQVTRFDSGRIFNFAFSPDGKQLALSRGSINSDVVLIKNASE